MTEAMRLDLLQQIAAAMYPTPRITHADLAREIRILYRHDLLKAESAVGNMYGYAFRKAEEAYEQRGSRGKHVWA